MFLLVPANAGCPGQTAVKWLLLLLLSCRRAGVSWRGAAVVGGTAARGRDGGTRQPDITGLSSRPAGRRHRTVPPSTSARHCDRRQSAIDRLFLFARQWRSQKFSTGAASFFSIPFCPFPFSCPTRRPITLKNRIPKKLCIFLTGVRTPLSHLHGYATVVGEVTSQSLWSRYDRRFMGIKRWPILDYRA